MNLRQFANAATQTINPNTPALWRRSTGYSIDPVTRRQVPIFSDTPGMANIQALDGDDLKQLDGLNIQGVVRVAYWYGNVTGVVRPDGKGNDELIFKSQAWNVFKVLETWPDWCKVAIVYQGELP